MPITLAPAAAQVAVGAEQTVQIDGVMPPFTATVSAPAVLQAAANQSAETLTLTGLAPGAAEVSVRDARGMTAVLPVRVAYTAGSIPSSIAIALTGDPASVEYVKEQAAQAVRDAIALRPGAQSIVDPDQMNVTAPLDQDDVDDVAVPVLLQGDQYFSVSGTVHVRVVNVAAPKITPDKLMVSDYPERLTANGVLFSADIEHTKPSRFLYFHYNPPGQPARRIVLRLHNPSPEPADIQLIRGEGGPDPNEMEAGHDATRAFLSRLVQNEGRIVVVKGDATVDLATQDLPPKDIACALLQLRVLDGGTVHLTLFAEDANASTGEPLAGATLLTGSHKHARGVYAIPEFHYSTLWNVTDKYLELPVGEIPLPNLLQGEALSGDYGVIQSFVVKVENPTAQPQAIAIYENPRGGRATGTYLIDGTLIQSHQTPPFSRYKIRQYVVPARGFVRVTIVTTPDSGSSYPLRLIFAPDDGSVPPGAAGSPVY